MMVEPNVSPEQSLAEEAFSLLGSMGAPEETRIGSVVYMTNVTERVDMLTIDERQVGLRLRGLPTLAISVSSDGLAIADEYFVMEVRQADTEMADEFTDDTEVKWQPYICMIINTQKTGEVAVVNSETGKDLEPGDLLYAQCVLDAMRKEYRNQNYEESLADAAHHVMSNTCVLDAQNTVPFDSADFFQTSYCDSCGHENVPCEHNPYTLN